MKNNKATTYLFTSVLIALLAMTPPAYAEIPNNKASIDEVKKESQDLIEALKSYTESQRDEALKKAKTAMDDLDKRIDALETNVTKNWEKMDKATREKARANLKALRQHREEVAEKYDSLKASTSNAWEHMKKGFADAYSSLHDAWEKSEKEFGAD